MPVTEKIVDKLVNLDIIDREDKELYTYGFKQGFILLLNLITTIVIGHILKMTLESLVVVVSYSFIRGYAGGYHANSPITCYLLSIFMVAGSLVLVKWLDWNDFLYFMMTGIPSIIILILSPVEDGNKPLEDIEIEVFKKRANIHLGILILIILISRLIGSGRISQCIIISLFMISIMLILGKIKNMIRKANDVQNIEG